MPPEAAESTTLTLRSDGYVPALDRILSPRQQAIWRREILTPEQCDVIRGHWLAIANGTLKIPRHDAPFGPGTKLQETIAEFAPGCGNGLCGERVATMNANGLEWCRANRETIIGWLEESAAQTTWREFFQAGSALFGKPWFDKRPWATRRERLASILDEALRRAERA